MSEDHEPKKYRFFVDAKEYFTNETALTGAQIKAQAGISAGYQLFLEEEGDKPDKEISDGTSVNMDHGVKHFFAVPPATFGTK